MCSSPSPPSSPKIDYEPVDTYQSYKQHSRYQDFLDWHGEKTRIDDDDDVRQFNEWLLMDTFETESKDENFRKAWDNLISTGNLSGLGDVNYDDRKADQFRKRYRKQNKGDAGGWKEAYARKSFKFTDDADLQRVYDEKYRLEQEDYRRQSEKEMQAQTDAFLKEQEKSRKQANRQQERMMKQMQRQNNRTSRENRKALEEMMDQPQFSPKQAALPQVQYKAKTPDPVPVAPAPPPQMNISPAPAPELVNTGNPMAIVRQSATARTRTRQRTRGTATLT